MAVNFLPLLLLGGGAALVVAASKKKEDEGPDCPAEVTVPAGELQTIANRATSKHGNEATPFNEVKFVMAEALPPGCNPGSKIRIKLSISDKDILEISAADFYMVGVSSALDDRLKSGKINAKQSEKFWGDALDWYKKNTGKNFDPQALTASMMKGASVLAESMAEAFLEALSGVGVAGPTKKEKRPEAPSCPSEWVFDFNAEVDDYITHIVDAEVAKENKNPTKIGDEVFNGLAPEGCKKTDYHNVVDFRVDVPGWKEAHMMNMASFYVAIVFQSALRLKSKGLITDSAMDQLQVNMNAWYKSLTGSDLASD